MDDQFQKSDLCWAQSKKPSEGFPKFNIGGFKFQTTMVTLSKSSITTNYFTDILSKNIPCPLDEEGNYFIDR